jgi:hypothetical protein
MSAPPTEARAATAERRPLGFTMKPIIIAAGIAAAWAIPAPAEAARCPAGNIYRVTHGVCVSKSAASKQGIYKPRKAKASTRHRHRRTPVYRPPVQLPKQAQTELVRVFGTLIPMPEVSEEN